MSSDSDGSVAINVLGILGALIPQIYINYKRKSTQGLQPSMMLLWATAGLPLGIHNILANLNVALQVQPQILTSLSLITWSQVMFYGHNWKAVKCALVLAALFVVFAGIEIAVIFGFKHGSSEAVPEDFLTSMAVLAALGLALGVLRHYYDIYTHRSVRGISWAFVFLDAAGDLTSLLSVVIQQPPDFKSAAIYGTELVLWIGIMIAGGLGFNFRQYLGRKRNPEGIGDGLSQPSVFRTSATSLVNEYESQGNAEGQSESSLRLRRI